MTGQGRFDCCCLYKLTNLKVESWHSPNSLFHNSDILSIYASISLVSLIGKYRMTAMFLHNLAASLVDSENILTAMLHCCVDVFVVGRDRLQLFPAPLSDCTILGTIIAVSDTKVLYT